ncbi:NADH-ubiquinone oxidoreductase-F iron-sulfur binding region domain-containing protein [Methanoregula sp.]|uniref:(2Fe-2S) ferredoxin domain-containing protein n=1 Tax=Methanoregula sp. TaxID=2052170 RepID=UPI002612705C|nr:NADH-ubiquinone oxidoreductase-F iron-sulfur binding region domain-containing protein [Methanoregula sp.]MDD5143545.1 NADH-ubiquinone oxidoreductase-F iron-sulfur binding region domain-containing protein [Methanoregula sp.]
MRVEAEADLKALQATGLKKLKPDKPRIAVGLATCGAAVGGRKVYDRLREAIAREGAEIDLVQTGCIGYCREEPLVNITLPGKSLVILRKVTEADADAIVRAVLNGKVPEDKALCRVPAWDHVTGFVMEYGKGFDAIPLYQDVPFFAPQRKVILRNAGFIDPEDIGEYFAVGGYAAAWKALHGMEPEAIIAEVEKSGLRGRGGAGFPTGLKWRITRDAPGGAEKYLVCNADEGDPGAYMNRNEMESDPHMLIEGMIIGAFAMGLRHGLIYIRSEYPLAIERLGRAIGQAREYGILGENIMGTGLSFDIRIARGAGAFVCGESTALVASIEGRTGRPHPRPPRLTDPEGGLFGKPTDLNNVETWCNVPAIVANGSGWYAGIGAKGNTGTKVFSLVGKVDRVGLVEVSLGTPIRTIVFDAGNGGANGKKVKAVQTGGPSGGCIPLRLFDMPVDYESLNKAGSIMGSGGIVVMDEDTDMVDIARYFTGFATGESCGKCVPCREGLKHTLLLINRIQAGKASKKDLATLQEVCETIAATSLCGLGQTAPNPVLTTLAYFREEYEAKVRP